MKKLARHFKGQPRVVRGKRHRRFELGRMCKHDRARMAGASWSGTSGVKAWSTTQKVVALSSGEAEYSAVKGASEGLGFLAGCADLGIWVDGKVSLRVSTDSSACKGICPEDRARQDQTHRCYSGFRTWFEKSVSG